MQHGPRDDASVIPFTGALKAMRYQPLREIDAYWEAIRAGRLVPRRSDVDPRGIENALEYAFIVERIATGIGRLRIAGSHLCDLMGMEVRGMPLSAFMTADTRSRMGDLVEEVFDAPAKVEISLDAECSIGKPALEARMILLPMRSDLGDVTRALGAFVTSGDVGRTPRRFRITGDKVTPLLGDFMPREERNSPLNHSFSEPAAPSPSSAPSRSRFAPVDRPEPPSSAPARSGRSNRSWPHLRLVKSDTSGADD